MFAQTWQSIQKIFTTKPIEIIPGIWYLTKRPTLAQFIDEEVPVNMLQMVGFYVINPEGITHQAKITLYMKGVEATTTVQVPSDYIAYVLVKPYDLFTSRNPKPGDTADLKIEIGKGKNKLKMTVYLKIIDEAF